MVAWEGWVTPFVATLLGLLGLLEPWRAGTRQARLWCLEEGALSSKERKELQKKVRDDDWRRGRGFWFWFGCQFCDLVGITGPQPPPLDEEDASPRFPSPVRPVGPLQPLKEIPKVSSAATSRGDKKSK